LLSTVRDTIRPLIDFQAAAFKKEVSVAYAPSVTVAPLTAVSPFSKTRLNASRLFPVRVDLMYVFTKRFNPNKLYIDTNTGIFLSSGIILKFMKQDGQRFLKKRLKVWHNYVKALKLLQRRPLVAYFKDMSGKKSIFFSKLHSSGVKVKWSFVKLFSSCPNTGIKRSRRIKR
jgi:hypothetical protein